MHLNFNFVFAWGWYPNERNATIFHTKRGHTFATNILYYTRAHFLCTYTGTHVHGYTFYCKILVCWGHFWFLHYVHVCVHGWHDCVHVCACTFTCTYMHTACTSIPYPTKEMCVHKYARVCPSVHTYQLILLIGMIMITWDFESC